MPFRLALLLLACFFLPRGPLSASGFVVVIDPTFRPPPGRPAWAPLEVREHAIATVIDGQVATTTVDQEFYNPGGRIAEATYFFPIPRDAQIEKFQLEINGKWTDPELLDAAKARDIYEDIVRRAKDPALLEYAGLRLFKARLFPIESQSTRRIRLSYREVLPLDFGALTWRYPFAEKGGTAKRASVRVEIKAERAWASTYSPSHPVTVKPDTDGRRTVVEWESRDGKPTGDFELICTPRPGKADAVGLTMFTYREPGAGDDEDGWFALFAAPPPERAGGDAKPAPKDVVFVLDTSGSMAGPKIAQARKALTFCVDRLNDGDRFDVIRFSSESESLFGRLTEAAADSRKRAQDFITRLRAAGGTAIHDALRTALAARSGAKDRPFIVVFLTDGLANIGPSRNEDILALVKKGDGSAANARVFTFGIGNDVNTHLLDLLAEQTRAASQYVLPEEDIEVKVSNFFAKVTEPALTDVRVELRGGGGGARLSQYHPSTLPDLFAGDQLVLAGRFRGRGDAEIVLRGRRGGADREFVAKVSLDGGRDREFIPRLWATRRVAFLLDEIRLRGETTEVRDEVTRLARKYGLVTPYTAYLILEDEARRDVPGSRRTLGQFDKDAAARDVFAESYTGLKKEETGAGAVRGALAQDAARNAAQAGAAMDSANAQIFGRARSAPGARIGAAPPAPATIDRIERQTAQAARYVAGRAFFQNGSQWVDASVQARAKGAAAPKRIAFNSDDYFKLLRDHPEAAPWFALGPNVLLTLGGADYEIHE